MESVSYERGRFYVGPNGFPRFAGSASGVYLADTVRSQVSPSAQPRLRSPGIEEAFIARNNEAPRHDDLFYDPFILKARDLRDAPAIRTALTRYFSTWHPLFPFLDGAYIIECFENAVQGAGIGLGMAGDVGPGVDPNAPAFPGLTVEEGMVLTAIFMALLAIADLDAPPTSNADSYLPRLQSSTQANLLANLVFTAVQNSAVNDLFAIQALIAIMLYFYVSRTLRPAMHLSGTVSNRYLSTFKDPADREMRKRVFWALYVLDRLLTAEFGIPIMLHDTDIDTCRPGGTEAHAECPESPPGHPARTPLDNGGEGDTVEGSGNGTGTGGNGSTVRPLKRRREGSTSTHLLGSPAASLQGSPVLTLSPGVIQPSVQQTMGIGTHQHHYSRLLPAYSVVGIARLTGRAMEVFNKSLRYRSLNSQETLQLRTELERWWNEISFDSGTDDDDGDEHNEPESDPRTPYRTLLTCMYHHQIINLCRPALSLAPTALAHAYALQTCVASARVICNTLAHAVNTNTGRPSSKRKGTGDADHDQSNPLMVLWPGYVDMVFFASLILVYGNKRDASNGVANPQRLRSELRRAIRILEAFQARWNLRPFIKALRTLLDPASPAGGNGNGNGRDAGMPTAPKPLSATGGVLPDGNTAQVPLAGEQLFDAFLFDFDTFELQPQTQWAFHMSLPGSPSQV